MMFLILSSVFASSSASDPEAPRCPEVFASAVHEFIPGAGVEPDWADPKTALGPPDFVEGTGAVSLGNASEGVATLTVSFPTSIQQAKGPDVRIYERGPSAEPTLVEVYDGKDWILVGRIAGSVREIDLEGANLSGRPLSKLRLTAVRDNAAGPWAGPDIDAIGLLNSCQQKSS